MTDEVKMRENSEWYYANLAALLSKCEGRYVAVANRSLLGDYGGRRQVFQDRSVAVNAMYQTVIVAPESVWEDGVKEARPAILRK